MSRINRFGVGVLLPAAMSMQIGAQEQSTDESDGALQEIVVTAQKRDESLSRFAGALVAVTGESLAQSGVTDIRNLGATVTGVMFSTNGTIVSPSVRGIGSTQYSPLGGPSVGFNLDGVPVDGMIAPNAAFFDVSRVEVLKGPQGTLYGRNATAGVINVVTNRPTIGEFGGTVDLQGGNYNELRAEGSVNVPVGEKSAVRFSGLRATRDGFYDNGYADLDDYAGRLQWSFEPNDALSLLLVGDYFHQGGQGGADVPLPVGSRGTDASDPYRQTYYPSQRDAYVDNFIAGAHAELTADLGFGTFVVIPAYHKFARDTVSYQGSFRSDVRDVSKQKSLEVRFSKSTNSLDWLAGVYYFDDDHRYDADYLNPTNCDGTPSTSFVSGNCLTINGNRSVVPQESRAAFGQMTYRLSDRVRLTGGLRYTRDKRSIEPNLDYTLNAFPGGPPVVVGSAFPIQPPPNLNDPSVGIITATASATFNDTSYKVGAEFDLSETALLYANVSTGYKAGGINDGNATLYEPEKLLAYEAGYRATFAGVLRMHLNAYYWDYENHQEAGVYFVPSFGILNQVTTIPKGKIAGSDLEVQWAISPVDSLQGAVSYLYSDTGAFSLPSGIASATGHAYINAPKWDINIGYRRQFFFSDWRVEPSINSHIVSSYNTDFRFTDVTRQGGFTKTDINLTVGPQDEKWYLNAYVHNLQDKAVIVSAQAAPGLPPPQYWGFLGEPRTYGLRAVLKF
jgi:iron complex outermembrane receptor protein